MNAPNHNHDNAGDTTRSALPIHPVSWELTTNPVQRDDHDPPNSRSPDSPADPPAVESRKATRLFGRAQDAAAVRNYQTHPDVAALNIERWRARCNALIWCGVLFFLGWTTPNVQQFVAGGAVALSPVWVTGWFVEPAIALPLMGILWAEQVAGRYGVRLAGWPRFTKWFALSATYSMNTWAYWAARDPQGIVVHSIPPLMVFAFAEVLPIVRERMTASVWRARSDAIRRQNEDGSDHDGESREPVSDRIVATATRVAEAIRARPTVRTDSPQELPDAGHDSHRVESVRYEPESTSDHQRGSWVAAQEPTANRVEGAPEPTPMPRQPEPDNVPDRKPAGGPVSDGRERPAVEPRALLSDSDYERLLSARPSDERAPVEPAAAHRSEGSTAHSTTAERRSLVAELLDENPDMTGPEIAEAVGARLGHPVSVATAKRDRAAVQRQE